MANHEQQQGHRHGGGGGHGHGDGHGHGHGDGHGHGHGDGHGHGYIHAMGHAALTPIYDPFVRLVAREQTFKGRLVERLALRAGERVLDVGCGTGTLAVMIARRYPGAEVTGIDGDAEIVERARGKAVEAGTAVTFRAALATELPFADGSFARVTSTLMAHHLPTEAKAKMFEEIRRVLTPRGTLHLVDIGPARSGVGRRLQRLAGREMLADNYAGRVPELMRAAGLRDVAEEDRVVTVLGPLVFWRGTRDGA